MNTAPLISVVIPTWNRAEDLRRAIASVLAQTYPVHEILVCDDGSTDHSEAVVRETADLRVRWITGSRAGCPAVPRNRGIAASEGNWIAFLDSDDVWLPEKLEAQIAIAQKTGAGAVTSNAYREMDGAISGLKISEDRGFLRFSDLLWDNKVVCSSMLLKRAVLEKTGGFPEPSKLRVGEDFCLWLKVSKVTRIAYAAEAYLVYRDDPVNSVRANAASVAKQRWYVFTNFLRWRWSNGGIATLSDMLGICAISLGRVIKSSYYENRAKLGAIRRKLGLRRDVSGSVDPGFFENPVNCNDPSEVSVSVILPVHNACAYLRRAIDSILAQTYQNFELIVIDDASSDGSKAVLDCLNDSRIIRIAFEKNCGIVDALNAGLKMARGRYIARMDADDFAQPERFQQQVECLDRNPELVVVGSWIQGFGDVRREYIHRYPVDHEEIRASLLFESPFAHPSVMFRRKAVEQLEQPYSLDFPYVEDWELWSRLITVGKGANLKEPLLQYRIHAKSSSQVFTDTQSTSKQKLLKRIYAESGLPYRDEFVLKTDVTNMDWLKGCYSYFSELLQLAEKSVYLNPKAFAQVLQAQLYLRARQMSLLGISVAWFVFRKSLVRLPLLDRVNFSIRVLLLTNARALLRLTKPSRGVQ